MQFLYRFLFIINYDYRLIMWRFFKLDLLEFISSELS